MKVVLIPSTFTAEIRNQLLRTYKIGEVARACATFKINKIIVYYDKDPKFDSHGLGRRIVKLLSYAGTPPYLKKYLFKMDPELKYAGLIPPINMPSHEPAWFKLNYRLGYAVKDDLIDIGLPKKAVVKGVKKKSLVTINLKTLSIGKPDSFFNYNCYYDNNEVNEMISKLKSEGLTIIGTSRKGLDYRQVKLPSDNYALVFGSAHRGLEDLGAVKSCDKLINFIPNQGVKSIRTEEALSYALAVMNRD